MSPGYVLARIRSRLWLFAFVFVVFATNLILGTLWIITSQADQWYEPALYVIALLFALFGLPDIRGLLLAEAELEQQMAENLVTYLEDEGLLYLSLEGNHPEHPKDCYQTADELRKGLTNLLSRLPRKCNLFSMVGKIRGYLNRFMRKMEDLQIQKEERESNLPAGKIDSFRSLLHELRSLCAQELECIGSTYKVKDVQSLLDKMNIGQSSLASIIKKQTAPNLEPQPDDASNAVPRD